MFTKAGITRIKRELRRTADDPDCIHQKAAQKLLALIDRRTEAILIKGCTLCPAGSAEKKIARVKLAKLDSHLNGLNGAVKAGSGKTGMLVPPKKHR